MSMVSKGILLIDSCHSSITCRLQGLLPLLRVVGFHSKLVHILLLQTSLVPKQFNVFMRTFGLVLLKRATREARNRNLQCPVVRTPVSANPGLNFNLGFFFFLSKAFSWIIFSIFFRVSNHHIVGKEN